MKFSGDPPQPSLEQAYRAPRPPTYMDAHYALYIWARAKRLVVYVIPSNECPYSMKGFQNMGSFIFLARTRFQAGDNTEKIWAHQFFAKQKNRSAKGT